MNLIICSTQNRFLAGRLLYDDVILDGTKWFDSVLAFFLQVVPPTPLLDISKGGSALII